MSKKIIEIFVDNNNNSPFKDWYLSLDKKTIARIQTRFLRLELGHYGDYKKLAEGINELRLHFGPGYRIYFGESINTLVLLLYGGDKSSQKKDIKKAIQLWKKYKERNGE